jgi:hypothetical protein
VAASTHNRGTSADVVLGDNTTLTGAPSSFWIYKPLSPSQLILADAAATSGAPTEDAQRCFDGTLDTVKASLSPDECAFLSHSYQQTDTCCRLLALWPATCCSASVAQFIKVEKNLMQCTSRAATNGEIAVYVDKGVVQPIKCLHGTTCWLGFA